MVQNFSKFAIRISLLGTAKPQLVLDFLMSCNSADNEKCLEFEIAAERLVLVGQNLHNLENFSNLYVYDVDIKKANNFRMYFPLQHAIF